jgi:alkanesulfonate monooxygenase SsuD/methylene tetrahydromethanopterin reductase-like flavin-dependent oxidoreductase (luciferase family)
MVSEAASVNEAQSGAAVRIGFKLPNCGGVLCRPEWAEPRTIHDLAGRADSLGFDSVWLHDHLVTPRELRDLGPLRFYEPLITMATLAQAFPRLSIGVATVVLPLRDPVLLAKQIGTLDGYFPGRFMFGLGAGRYESEFQSVGLDLFARRGRVSKEYLEIIHGLLTEDSVTYRGEYRQLSDASMYPQPSDVAPSSVWYAGNSPVAAARAGRYADGWIGASITVAEVEDLLEPMLAAREAEGLDRSNFALAVSATIERPRAPDPTRSDDQPLHLHASTISGSADEIAEQLNGYVRVGVTHFLLSLRADEIERLHDDMEWFSAEVVPLVKRGVRQTANSAVMQEGGIP